MYQIFRPFLILAEVEFFRQNKEGTFGNSTENMSLQNLFVSLCHYG